MWMDDVIDGIVFRKTEAQGQLTIRYPNVGTHTNKTRTKLGTVVSLIDLVKIAQQALNIVERFSYCVVDLAYTG